MNRPADDLPITPAVVARLLAEQAPGWASLPRRRHRSTGTDNAIFRLGDRAQLRLPRRAPAIPALEKELDWLPRLRPLPLAVPTVLARGRVAADPPFSFGILDWMAGEIALPTRIANWPQAARTLAGFLRGLHRIDTSGAPLAGPANSRRGVALPSLGDVTLPAIVALADEIDTARALALWDSACAEDFTQPPVWLHGDLKADNLIARDGALVGVIDWGLAAVGDPAADYAAVWSWLDPSARHEFRTALGLSDNDWRRGQGWALYGAVIALSFYRGGRNEALCRLSRLTLGRLGLLL